MRVKMLDNWIILTCVGSACLKKAAVRGHLPFVMKNRNFWLNHEGLGLAEPLWAEFSSTTGTIPFRLVFSRKCKCPDLRTSACSTFHYIMVHTGLPILQSCTRAWAFSTSACWCRLSLTRKHKLEDLDIKIRPQSEVRVAQYDLFDNHTGLNI